VKVSLHTRRFLSSTRGQIVEFLREGPSTVAELALKLSLTDNAVRAHLATLERDGLVRQSGERPGARKPHLAYELTSDAEELFPKAYALILNEVLGKLENCLGKEPSDEFLRELGREMAARHRDPEATFEANLDTALKVIEELGGRVRVERGGGKITICGAGCPLAAVVTQHDSMCDMLAAFIARFVDREVAQTCRREERPRCRFEIEG
jgi:predicted ArsR family transcriptional regulator